MGATVDEDIWVHGLDPSMRRYLMIASGQYVAFDLTKSFDFKPKTHVLRLNREIFKPGELEKEIGISDSTTFWVNPNLKIPGYGTVKLEGVMKIEYHPPKDMLIRYFGDKRS